MLLMLTGPAIFAIDNLKLNSKLDYRSDSLDGRLITGDGRAIGVLWRGQAQLRHYLRRRMLQLQETGAPNRELYNKYHEQVHFVVVDLDVERSPEQQKLVKQYYKGYIPHVVVLDARGEPLYNQSGEVDSRHIEEIFKSSLGH